MQQSFSSSKVLHLVLLYCFLNLLPFWSHALCTLPPLQLLVASAASAACSEVLSCGKKERDAFLLCLPLAPGWHSVVTWGIWGCWDGCPGMCGHSVPCQKAWHEVSDSSSQLPTSQISRTLQQQKSDIKASSSFTVVISYCYPCPGFPNPSPALVRLQGGV